MTRFLSSLLMICAVSLISTNLYAQEKGVAEMADTMRSNGKIYVVVAVCLVILTGLFLYVYSIDRKIKKLER